MNFHNLTPIGTFTIVCYAAVAAWGIYHKWQLKQFIAPFMCWFFASWLLWILGVYVWLILIVPIGSQFCRATHMCLGY